MDLRKVTNQVSLEPQINFWGFFLYFSLENIETRLYISGGKIKL